MNERYEKCLFCGKEYKEYYDVLFTICPKCTEEIIGGVRNR